MRLFIVLTLTALGFWGLSFIGVGLSGLICDLLTWIGTLSPWPAFESWLAFLACFLLLRLLLLPFQLNHARVNQQTVEPKTSPEDPDPETSAWEPDHPIALNFELFDENHRIVFQPPRIRRGSR